MIECKVYYTVMYRRIDENRLVNAMDIKCLNVVSLLVQKIWIQFD